MNPLDQLADIQVPDNASLWPLPWGYWLTLVVILLTLIWIIRMVMQKRKFNKMKNNAIQALNTLELNDPYFFHRVQIIIKQACQHYYPQINSNTLHSHKWRTFVMATYKGAHKQRLEDSLTLIFNQMYSQQTNNQSNVEDSNSRKQTVVTAINDWLRSSVAKQKSTNEDVLATTKSVSEVGHV